MVWRIPRKLVATQLRRDGCILRCTTWMSRVKTRPEACPTRTDNHAAQKGGLTSHHIALSPAQSCLGGGGEAAVVKASQLRIPSCPPPSLRGAVTLVAEEEEGGDDGIQEVGGGRRVSW
jgi:hypothetical protein